MPERVAVLGLGLMGREIAHRIEAAGCELVVYNRSPEPRAEFAERGAAVAETPARTAELAPVCVSMLANGAAVEAVTTGDDGLLSAPPEGRTLIEMSTIEVAASARVAEAAERGGVAYVRAPVSGNPGVVAAGRLTILLSGRAEEIERVRPVLEAIGPNLVDVGEGENARVMKLALNLVLGGLTELTAEALVMCEASGLARRAVLETMSSSVIGSPFLAYKKDALADRDYSTTFSVVNLLKDLRLILDHGAAEGVPLPVTEVLERRAAEAERRGMGELDLAALVPLLEHEAGRLDELPD